MAEPHSKAGLYPERRKRAGSNAGAFSRTASYVPAANSNTPGSASAPCTANRARKFKRAFDITSAIVALLIFSPMFIVVSLAIGIGAGGTIFRREARCGFNNKQISVLKFRSPVEGLETPIGRFLRRTGIEGFPQFINVLRGEMSIVGPDPFDLIAAQTFQGQIADIFRGVKPGMISWARVNGDCVGSEKNLETIQRRIEHELFYCKHWSLLFDIKIILMCLSPAHLKIGEDRK